MASIPIMKNDDNNNETKTIGVKASMRLSALTVSIAEPIVHFPMGE